jgi:hypothetical protein
MKFDLFDHLEKIMRRISVFLFAIISISALLIGPVQAEQYVDVGKYVIHYNALSTNHLAPEVARAYTITRSQNRAMLSISVLIKGGEGQLDEPAEAEIEASATNLAGQRREVDMRLITEQQAKYYVGIVKVYNEEILDFKLRIKPGEMEEPYELVFRQQFYVD